MCPHNKFCPSHPFCLTYEPGCEANNYTSIEANKTNIEANTFNIKANASGSGANKSTTSGSEANNSSIEANISAIGESCSTLVSSPPLSDPFNAKLSLSPSVKLPVLQHVLTNVLSNKKIIL
ncbi:hypothetical protein M422DRAFT_254927 [Sphaerobolus stellatus SS14]|uniref:Uncharacterized protein n=1 Tax=Sphaerobolus stellatus (strain SS14) TaxID=990650 RepID=A0A0C9VTS6_SPHS4|nr:hypothetical protein M422DRAFT_254927 [Sphaerobolus stellatus SS14]